MYRINQLSYCLLVLFIVQIMSGCASITDSVVQIERPVFPAPPNDPRIVYERTLASSADVEIEAENAIFKRLITGAQRTGIGLGKPFGITVHKGRVFVSDTLKRMVVAFDVPQAKFLEIGTKSPGELLKPMGLDVDQFGNLYVCDATMKHVVVFNRDGQHLRTIGSPELFSRPAGLTVDAEGKRVFVVDTGGVKSDRHRIVVLDAQSGAFLYAISKRGSKNGELNLPRDATIGVDGNLYVVDGGNFRVQVFSQEGEFIKSFGGIGRRSGQFSRPKGIATDKSGNIYVADAAFGNYQIFNQSSQLLLAVGSRGGLYEPAKYMLPAGLAIDEDGRIYMVDQYFKKIDIYRPVSLNEQQGYLVYKDKNNK